MTSFYAAHNASADILNGSRGFLNTWEVSRFPTKAARDAFVAAMDNKAAKPVTRKAAVEIWRGTYLCVGSDIPAGGLFGADRYGPTNFWNECTDWRN